MYFLPDVMDCMVFKNFNKIAQKNPANDSCESEHKDFFKVHKKEMNIVASNKNNEYCYPLCASLYQFGKLSAFLHFQK